MKQFFFAYECHSDSGLHKGFRVFEAKADTSEEIVNLINRKLDEIAKQYKARFDNTIITSFNRI